MATALAVGAACSVSAVSMWAPLFELVGSATKLLSFNSVGAATLGVAAISGPAVAATLGSAEAAAAGVALTGIITVAMFAAASTTELVVGTFAVATFGVFAFMAALMAALMASLMEAVWLALCLCACMCALIVGLSLIGTATAYHCVGRRSPPPPVDVHTTAAIAEVPSARAAGHRGAEQEYVPIAMGVPVGEESSNVAAVEASSAHRPRLYPEPSLLGFELGSSGAAAGVLDDCQPVECELEQIRRVGANDVAMRDPMTDERGD